MRWLRPRWTIRFLMVAVASVALTLAAGRLAQKWARLAKAERILGRQEAYFAEGRITLNRMMPLTQKVIDAELAFCLTTWGQVESLSTRIEQAARMLAKEEKDSEGYLDCWGVGRTEREEAAEVIEEWRALRNRLALGAW